VTEAGQWVHGSHLGREHCSIRLHLIEDHHVSPDRARDLGDAAIHGLHDGRHRTIWAYAYNLPHPASSELGK